MNEISRFVERVFYTISILYWKSIRLCPHSTSNLSIHFIGFYCVLRLNDLLVSGVFVYFFFLLRLVDGYNFVLFIFLQLIN